MIITFNLCAWCRRKYYLELQLVEDRTFCSPKCREEWEHSLENAMIIKTSKYGEISNG